MPFTGVRSSKLYRCGRCGFETTFTTNHWGEIYPECSSCSWKNPLQKQVAMTCLEPMPTSFLSPSKGEKIEIHFTKPIDVPIPVERV